IHVPCSYSVPSLQYPHPTSILFPYTTLFRSGPEGNILDNYVLYHDEPILLIGIPEQKLHDFAGKYQGIHVNQRVVIGRTKDESRSEEHTSELQSRENLVCRLLLEKKKKKHQY